MQNSAMVGLKLPENEPRGRKRRVSFLCSETVALQAVLKSEIAKRKEKVCFKQWKRKEKRNAVKTQCNIHVLRACLKKYLFDVCHTWKCAVYYSF